MIIRNIEKVLDLRASSLKNSELNEVNSSISSFLTFSRFLTGKSFTRENGKYLRFFSQDRVCMHRNIIFIGTLNTYCTSRVISRFSPQYWFPDKIMHRYRILLLRVVRRHRYARLLNLTIWYENFELLIIVYCDISTLCILNIYFRREECVHVRFAKSIIVRKRQCMYA